MRTVMMSYNTFVPGVANGWVERNGNAVLLLQNESGKTWGVTQVGPSKQQWRNETEAIIDPLWQHLTEILPTVDEFVFYVGSYGAEHVIELAAKFGLTPERTVFVLCDCNWSVKTGLIDRLGFGASRRITCECGGQETMRVMFQSALEPVPVTA